MRWSIGKQIAPRGAGLGNEIFPWAKAYLGAQAMGLRLIDPAWRLNPRRYDKELETSGLASLLHVTARIAPHVAVTREMVNSTHESDYFLAMCKLADTTINPKYPVLLHTSGMSGGYLAIRRAKRFLKASILGGADALKACEQLDGLPAVKVRVGVHIRGGDFHRSASVESGVFNQVLPLDWYTVQLRSLEHSLSLPLQVFLATDSPSPESIDATTVGGIRPHILGTSSISDLAILASCDILISSVSSFSMLAAFLSDSPYVWHRDQLGERGGWLSIWGHESQNEGGGPTFKSVKNAEAEERQFQRGYAHGMIPHWSPSVISYLESNAHMRATTSDLIYYGVVSSKDANR